MRTTSKRTFLKQTSSLALVTGLAPGFGGQAHAQTPDPALDDLARDLASRTLGQIIRPGQPEHAKIKYYNGRFDCVRSTAYVRPANAQGVQHVLDWAKRNTRKFAIRGGGHSFEGKSCHPELVLDMSRLTRITFKREQSTLEVEAGVRLGEVYKTLGDAEHVLPAGTCPTVGIVGHALGGGIGDFLPMFGYAAQSLTEVRLVTMAGQILTVTDRSVTDPAGAPVRLGDLEPQQFMTALRGGGQGSFGVVTGMTFKTHNVAGWKLASFKLDGASGVSSPRAIAIIQAWQAWREALPAPMKSMVSAKLNLSRSGSGFGIDISGLIALPADTNTNVADIRRTLDVLFRIPEFGDKAFSPSLTAAGAIKSFLDDGETTNNPKRRMLYGSSSALSAALPPRAVQHLIQNLPATVFASLYTSGGASLDRAATSLHPSEFLVEWTIYSSRRDTAAHRRIRALTSEIVKLAGFKDHGVPNYPDNGARDYFTNRSDLDRLRTLLDRDAMSTSSLLSGGLPRPLDGACR